MEDILTDARDQARELAKGDGMKDVGEWIAEHDVSMIVEPAPDRDGWEPGSSHYSVTIRRQGDDVLTTPFSMGPALEREPQLSEVLSCIAADVAAVENSRDFEDYAHELGFNPDSREAEAGYRFVQYQRRDLLTVFGPEAVNDLLYNVERE